MDTTKIGVFSRRDDLVRDLRTQCPQIEFTSSDGERDGCRVVIVDADSHAVLDSPPRSSVVRLVLCDGTRPPKRRHGEIRVARNEFLAGPDDYISLSTELADAALHAVSLEQQLSYLNEIRDMMSMVDADAVSQRITTTVLGFLGLDRGTLFLHDPRLERYVVSYSNDPDLRETGEFLPGVSPGLLQKALSSGQLIASDRAPNGRGMVIMPLQVQEDLIGVIKVPLFPDDVVTETASASVTRYLKAVAQVLSNIYQLTRSRDLAMRDDLTKAFNRRFFESYLDEEIERSRRYGTLFSIIFLDLDDLKMVNNVYGHLTGSRTLQEVAKRVLSAVRGIDKVVRFGGDEFCIILPQTDQDQAMAVANRVRKAMTAQPFQLDEKIEISITASFGIATYPTHALAKEDLVRQADAAMYRVKSTTKNAVGVAAVDNATKPPVASPS
jgi:diguanylate cyclase (GGDEF)-like protein